MFHMFSLVCSLIYGIKNRSGHDQSQSFDPILYASVPRLTFPENLNDSTWFCEEESKTHNLSTKN